ncbi:MAG: hypothetical protein PHV37_08080 [Candidatus Gastranaerophilales bacterium]|nr:hypothetical protein [Candidatus Gastranaerophilales bacterium]
MHNYYFKIKKNDTELEFSTDSLADFDETVLNWVENICKPSKNVSDENSEDAPKRMGFIDIKKLVTLKQIAKNIEQETETVSPPDFEAVLQESIEKPKIDLDNIAQEENELQNMINEKKPDSPLKVLILTVFFMIHLENFERFTIKQVNSRLVPIGEAPIAHSAFEDAINSDFISIVPDLTGLGDVTEYTLTQKGEEFFYNEL